MPQLMDIEGGEGGEVESSRGKDRKGGAWFQALMGGSGYLWTHPGSREKGGLERKRFQQFSIGGRGEDVFQDSRGGVMAALFHGGI